MERADQHVRNFHSIFQSWVARRPHRPVIKGERRNDEWHKLWMELIIDEPLPLDLPLVLGDAVHNYRCSLDHAMWELIGLDKGKQHNQLQFPVGKTQIDFEAMARGVITPSQIVKDFLVSLAVFPGGQGETLYAVHSLDRADKHRIITPVVQVSHIDSVYLIDIATQERSPVRPFYAVADQGAVYTAPRGFGINVERNVYPTPDAFFPRIDVFPNEPILPALWQMLDAVNEAVEQMERFAARHLMGVI